MKLNKMFLISITLFILLLSISSVSASDLNQDSNQTLATDSSVIETAALNEDVDVVQEIESSNQEVLSSNSEDSTLEETTNEIIVNDWNDLQYYCSLSDADYTLRLKENTNYYPDDVADDNYQIIVNNNVKIIGNTGAYIGDTSPDAGNITYTAIIVNDDSGIGITVENVTFKWIGTRYQPDGVFLQMGGNVDNNAFINCYFTNISTNLGHSSIVYIKKGNVIMTNCTFINCTTDFGCLSVYNPKDDPTGLCTSASMEVNECYFEGNYARTEPGCINNCGILVVNNSTFYKNSAFWWAGAIHTHGGANTTIYDSDFIDNLAGWNGGALYTYSYLQIYNTRFIGNNCTTNNGGGAIGACKYLHAPYIHIEDSLFENNENLCWSLDELSTSGTGRGGAISLMDEGGLEVYNSTFIKNSASIGTAICAINGGLSYGSPDVKIVGNKFINHTRIGDVLDVRVATGSVVEIRDNYYYNNSLVYEKLKLTADDPVNGFVTFHLDANLKNPSSFDADILDKSTYDVYVNGVYNTTVSNRTFTLNLGKGNSANVYVMPSISNSKSNEVFAGVPKKFIFVSPSGDDENNGTTRISPVKTLARAIELANVTENIVIMGGTFSESNLTINYNLTITAENGATITLTGQGFTITDGDVKFENLTFKNCKYGTGSTGTKNRLITQTNSGFLIMDGCVFESNEYKIHIDAAGILQGENLKFIKNKDGSVIKSNSISLKSSVFINNTATYSTAKGLVMYKTGTTKFEVENLTFINNTVSSGCIAVKKNKATITDCTFIGNSVTSGNKGSAILIEDSCSALVESCKFINNTDIGKYSSVIYVSSGTLLIRNSMLINNSYENTNGIVINGGETYLKKLQASNNWWGNTPDNLTKPALKVYGVSNQLPNGWDPAQYWLVLNATALSNEIELNEKVTVQFIFTQIDNNGNVTDYDSRYMPSFDLILTAVNGTCSNEKITVENGVATTYFTLTQMTNASLTGSFNGIDATINFIFKKSTPEVSIDADEITFGDTADIVVNVPSDATGNITVKVGNITKTAEISDSKATFSIDNLSAGNYTIEANYTGNERYESVIKTALLVVNKLESITKISIGDIELNEDVIVTISLSNNATGTVDVYVNGVKETINAFETFTIKNVQRGDYVVRAVYSGDSKYLSSEDKCRFEVAKFIPTVNVTVPDITYGEDVVVTVAVDSNATGNVTVTIDGKTNTSAIKDSQAIVKLSGIDAGNDKYVDVFYSGCNDYKNASINKTFNIAKANLDFTIVSNNIKYGNDEVIEIRLPARIGGTITVSGIKSETKNVPSSGLVTLTYADLAVGTYTVTAEYNGNNYVTAENSTTFEVLDWDKAQWANEGGDIKHTGKSSYDTIVNGEIKWSVVVDEIIGNMAIDSEGNIYVTTKDKIYSFDNNGNLRWTFESKDAGTNFAGIALSRDVVIAPRADDTLYFINQTTGERYGHSNIYQGSSSFSPIVDSNGNVYISGQGGAGNNPNLIIIPYRLWENGGSPTIIELGSNPVAAPTMLNDYLVAVPCDDGFKIVDINSKEIKASINGIINEGYAVVGDGNIVYTFLDNSIVAFSESGSKLWSSDVTGGVGKQLFLDSEIGLYSVNANGELYVYDTIDGRESKFCDLTVTSGILIGSNNNLYFGAGESFYAFDSAGNMLWKAKIGSEITGTPIMDENGTIYINAADKVYALNYTSLKDSNLEVSCENISFGENETITVTLNENATGTVSIIVNEVTYDENVSDTTIVKVISGLPAGNYTVKVTYNGDLRYSEITKYATFKVNKFDVVMDVATQNITYGETAVFNVTLSSDATGTVTVEVDGKSNSSTVNEGKATVCISGITAGDKTVIIEYDGDAKYNGKTINSTFNVNKSTTQLTISIPAVEYGETAVVYLDVPSDATGKVNMTVDGKSYEATIKDSKGNISVPNLKAGTYPVTVTYLGDSNYLQATASGNITVSKSSQFSIDTSLDGSIIDVTLPSDATGSVLMNVDGKNHTGTVENGKVSFTTNLASGSYNAKIVYSGDDNYASKSLEKIITIELDAVNISAPEVICYYSGVFTATLRDVDGKALSNASVLVKLNGKEYILTSDADGKVATDELTLAVGSYDVVVYFNHTDKYGSKEVTSKFTVLKSVVSSNMARGYNSGLDFQATFLDNSGKVISTKYISILVDGKSQDVDLENGVLKLNNKLAVGVHSISGKNPVTGEEFFNNVEIIKRIQLNKDIKISYSDAYSYSVRVYGDDGNPVGANQLVTMNVNKVTYKLKTDAKGYAKLKINLKPGTYTITIKFNGNSVKNKIIVKHVIKAKNIVKKKAKYYKYKVTLKKYTGKVIKYKKVTLKIKGKKYTKKTNKKGVATFKIKQKLKVGKYKMTIKFGKSTVKRTLKIKK
ncbi:Ig-like domain repeat protein [Methanobrevibacter sp.]|uniref:Ig-like domain repeat protein n=1 Tax=Methanobrevibacter sp. TaxID=66852 RepID=UPI003864C3CE